MFINVHSVSSPTPTSRVPNAAFWVTIHRDKVHAEEAAHITPPHNTVFLQYSQYSARSTQECS
jgi:hypothetical protein